jgi:hypothetical protein
MKRWVWNAIHDYECNIQWSSYCCKYLTVVDIPGFQKTIEWRVHHGKINIMKIEVKWLWLRFDYDAPCWNTYNEDWISIILLMVDD